MNKLDKVINSNIRTLYDNRRTNLTSEVPDTHDIMELHTPTPIVFVKLKHKHKTKYKTTNKSLIVLLDSGSSHSMIKYKHVKNKKHKFKKSLSTYSTAAGEYSTDHEVKLKFAFKEFDTNLILQHTFDIDRCDGSKGIGYDMIIGRDLLVKLKIDL